MQLDLNLKDNEDMIDEVFDKSESNVFTEVVFVCNKLMKKVHQCLTKSDFCRKIIDENLHSIEANWPELRDCVDF